MIDFDNLTVEEIADEEAEASRVEGPLDPAEVVEEDVVVEETAAQPIKDERLPNGRRIIRV